MPIFRTLFNRSGDDRMLASRSRRSGKAIVPILAVAVLVVGLGGASAAPGDPPSGVVTINPTRVLDTRTGLGVGAIGKVGPGQTIDVTIGGAAGVPVNATGVVANITVTNGSDPSFVTVWPTGQARPLASSLNVTPNQDLPNTVIIEIGAGGKISLYNNGGTVDIVADVTGYLLRGATTPAVSAVSRGTIDTPIVLAAATVQSLSLPAGNWVVFAHVDGAHNGTTGSTRMECALSDPIGTQMDYAKMRAQSNTGAEPMVFVSLSLQGVTTLATPGVVKTSCGSTNGTSSFTLTTARMTAIQVGSITNQ